ncbi:MAG: isoprenylcysteine carboxylmethyltransferase family protein [Chloroflexota bacterium]
MPRERWGRGEGWVVAQLALFAAIALAPRRVPGLPEWPAELRGAASLAGGALMLLGAGAAGLGALQLGRSLTIFPRPKEDGALVQTGLYRVVRHPIYGGIVLGAIGFSLLRAGVPSLLLSLALWAFFELKARREEAWLAEQFPEYQEYMRRVRARILPL